MEIVGEIMRAIQNRSTRPTKIMRAANLGWPPLMAYLEVLLRNQLLIRDTRRSRSSYRLTAKGVEVLNVYLRLKEEMDVLKLETPVLFGIGQVAGPLTRFGARRISGLRSGLAAANFQVLEDNVVGRSGAQYTFPLMVQGLSDSKYGFVFLNYVDESAVIRNFAKQLDADIDLNLVYTRGVTKEARRIASLDSILLLSSSRIADSVEAIAFLDSFRLSRCLLLEVDASLSYERVIEALVRREAEGSRVTVFTSKRRRTYSALRQLEGVRVQMMPRASGPHKANNLDRVASMQTLADLIEPDSSPTGLGRLVILDSFSDLLPELGTAGAYKLMKSVLRMTADLEGQRALFVWKRGSGTAGDVELVHRLVGNRLVYDSSGLRLPGEPEPEHT